MTAPPPLSDVNLLCDGQSVIDLDTEISDAAFDFALAEKQLDCAQINAEIQLLIWNDRRSPGSGL